MGELTTRRKTVIAMFVAALFAFTFYPIVENHREAKTDRFPFSYYPMFSRERDSIYYIYHYVGYGEDDFEYNLNFHISGSGGFNQVRRQTIKYAKRAGGGEKPPKRSRNEWRNVMGIHMTL